MFEREPFIDDPAFYGNSFPRNGAEVHSLVLHCTVGRRGRNGIQKTVMARKADPSNSLGVDFSCWHESEEEGGKLLHRHAPEGHYTHHVPGSIEAPDPGDRGALESANKHSYGCECVNPADPRPGKGGGDPLPGQEVIDAPWYPGGRYVALSPRQMEACWDLCVWAFSRGVRRRWPGYRGGRYIFGQLASDEREPGIFSHVQVKSNHGDGNPQTIYCLLRNLGWSAAEAYRLMRQVSASATRAGGVWSAPVPVPGLGWGFSLDSSAGLLLVGGLLVMLVWRGVLRPALLGGGVVL